MRNSKLKIFGLIGYPIGHTLSPYMHNAAFSRLGIKGVYIPVSVKPKELKKIIKLFKKSNITGFNVTVPYKSACMRYLDKIDPLAFIIGAVNTVALKNGRFIGYNTDATGFLKSLKQGLKFLPKNKTCLIIGAGGASRAVCFALAKNCAKEIFITDKVKGKAVSLARNIKKYFPGCKVKSTTNHELRTTNYNIDLLVNATPLGMKKTDPLPINPKLLHKNLAVYDLVYNPSPTKLVKLARKRKIKAANGLGMLLYQGAEAFLLWTRKKAPVKVMEKALVDHV